MKKEFRTSDIDFVAYLKTQKIDFIHTEKSKNNHRVMFGYNYDFGTLFDMQLSFEGEDITINMQEYRKERSLILDLIKLI